ncbi:FMN reductase [Streptomyces sp. YS415]|uniref:FMN reductase n=1 Tax=Streptomyces sp. YS415 TaxID=2944806 RepID=UPI002020D30D|nr:FMN reductase [Streptomyces sp. YS415]MCL7430332.1 FMN reductase [Streptomyces sp. YS415]
MRPLRLSVVSAGLSDPSSTRLLADRLTEATRQELAGSGYAVEVSVVEVRELAAEIARNLTLGSPGPELEAALDAVTRADGVIAVTPVFSASYSGLFKSFFDLLDPTALTGTPVLIAATGGTARHSLVLEHALRPLFTYLHALTVPTGVFAATEDWGTAGDAHTADLPARIGRAAHELARLVPSRAADEPGGREVPGQAPEIVPFAEQLAALGHAP